MSKNTGKKIKRIRVCKEKVVIYFFDKSKTEISYDTYASFHLFPNRELSKEELQEIENLNNISVLLNKALNFLKKSVMTEQQVRDKLYLKTKDRKKIEQVIKSLKNYDLINDKAFIEDFLIYAEEKKMGQYKIVRELIKRGINEESARKIVFKQSDELQKAVGLLPTLEKRYATKSFNEKKQKIFTYLLTHGFSSEIATKVVSKVQRNDQKELDLLEKEFDLIYDKFSKTFEEKELFEKVVNSLRNKGYKYSDIKKKWEERFYGID